MSERKRESVSSCKTGYPREVDTCQQQHVKSKALTQNPHDVDGIRRKVLLGVREFLKVDPAQNLFLRLKKTINRVEKVKGEGEERGETDNDATGNSNYFVFGEFVKRHAPSQTSQILEKDPKPQNNSASWFLSQRRAQSNDGKALSKDLETT